MGKVRQDNSVDRQLLFLMDGKKHTVDEIHKYLHIQHNTIVKNMKMIRDRGYNIPIPEPVKNPQTDTTYYLYWLVTEDRVEPVIEKSDVVPVQDGAEIVRFCCPECKMDSFFFTRLRPFCTNGYKCADGHIFQRNDAVKITIKKGNAQ